MKTDSFEQLLELIEAEVKKTMELYPEGVGRYDIYVSAHCLSDGGRVEHYNKQFEHLWALRMRKYDETGKVPTYITERLDMLPGYAIPEEHKVTFQYDLRDWINERIASFTSSEREVPASLINRKEVVGKTIDTMLKKFLDETDALRSGTQPKKRKITKKHDSTVHPWRAL